MDQTSYTYADFADHPDPSHRPVYLAGVLKSLRELPVGAAVLDAGCGGGDFSIGLAEAGFTVFGSDMSPSGIAAARARDIGRFEQGSVYDDLTAPFGLDHYDAIVTIEVIEHLYSPVTFARRMVEALRPGGLAIISTPYWGYGRNLVMALTNRTDRALTPLWEGGHIKHFSRKTLTKLMEDAGFETISFEGCHTGIRKHLPTFWGGMLMTFRKP